MAKWQDKLLEILGKLGENLDKNPLAGQVAGVNAGNQLPQIPPESFPKKDPNNALGLTELYNQYFKDPSGPIPDALMNLIGAAGPGGKGPAGMGMAYKYPEPSDSSKDRNRQNIADLLDEIANNPRPGQGLPTSYKKPPYPGAPDNAEWYSNPHQLAAKTGSLSAEMPGFMNWLEGKNKTPAKGSLDELAQKAEVLGYHKTGKFLSAVSEVGKATDNQDGKRELGSQADFIKGMGKLASMIPGKFGAALNAVTLFASATMKGVEALMKWNRSVFQSNMQFAEYSGAMASVKAQQEVRDIGLSRQRGDRRADSAGYQAEGMSHLESSVAPITDTFAKLTNYISGFFGHAFGTVIDKIDWVFSKILPFLAKDEKTSSDTNTGLVDDFLELYKNQGEDRAGAAQRDWEDFKRQF